MKNIETTTKEAQEEQSSTEDLSLEVLEDYLAKATAEEHAVAFVVFEIAAMGGDLAERTRATVYEHVKAYVETVGWEKEVAKHEDTEIILSMQSLLNLWRHAKEQASRDRAESASQAFEDMQTIVSGLMKAEKAKAGGALRQKSAEPDGDKDEPKTKKFSMDRRIDDANPAEQVIVDWLLKQEYKTKLACVMLSTMHIGDHGTDGIVNDIIGRWTTEILDNSANPPENITPEETVMTGAVVEMQLWEENF